MYNIIIHITFLSLVVTAERVKSSCAISKIEDSGSLSIVLARFTVSHIQRIMQVFEQPMVGNSLVGGCELTDGTQKGGKSGSGQGTARLNVSGFKSRRNFLESASN